MREAFTKKWHKDNTHDTETENTRKATENAAEKAKDACGEDC